ncbi:MAG: 1,4-dihydroxy-2-naphthoate octaprenyltransferase [Bacteroides sp.]|nr:1,4-dihydroxy-2-naphthoate octaprenyltransferase [Roseburia sp.]MCM1346213.1 1,4-dihydroxy-2-naphthoate octaprenyltransferase [Bacteroides sp.]MCM1420690.1 1,4-dihydroxy-2-naphthoate octaprenyltransferase [Bacteroides sp.]
MTHIKTNSFKAWMLAARPKTLTGAASPVLVGAAMTAGEGFKPYPFILCLLFAFAMQIDANFINDYFDYAKGTDREDRLGPERACAQGWVPPHAMKTAITITTVISCLIGLPLAFIGGLPLIAVGMVCVLFCFLYTTSLSYLGFGDLLVLIFFGIVPVGFTYYLQTGHWTTEVTWAGMACGFVTDSLLIINNYRDREQDAVSGKKTLIVRFGKKFGLCSYLGCGIIAVLFAACSMLSAEKYTACLFTALYLPIHILTYRKMRRMDGRELNSVLGETARNIFLFALLLSVLSIGF